MDALKIGKFTLTWLRGGVITLDGGAMFGYGVTLGKPKDPETGISRVYKVRQGGKMLWPLVIIFSR